MTLGQFAPIDPMQQFTDRLRAAEARVGELERAMGVSRFKWTDVSFENAWINYGSTWQDVQYRTDGDVVQLRGLARHNGTLAAGQTIFVLPTNHRPPSRIILIAEGSVIGGRGNNTYCRVDITSAGAVTLAETVDTGTSWVSLTGVSFSTV